jgi:serine/threonine-protein kinase RIM15
MWMVRPWIAPQEIKIDLPSVIVEGLGSGTEVLASYLTDLAESGLEDPAHHPPPLPVLCRICERQILSWWFEKHTELCLLERKAEKEVHMVQQDLAEQRHEIVKVLDALEARKSRPLAVDQLASDATQAAYNLLDLCDTALEISTPTLKESISNPSGEFQALSPLSKAKISQVVQWQSPSTNTLEQEQGLAALCSDSEKSAKAMVEAALHHLRIIEYSDRIGAELFVLVGECIDEAIRKAARIAAGHLTDSADEEKIILAHKDGFFPASFDGPLPLAQALREAEMGNHEGIISPMTSTLLTHSEFNCPILVPHHHRQQSSAASSHVMRLPPSPRLNSVNIPQARAIPPSIKDFEIIKPISKSVFGSVYLSKKKSSGDYFAIKVLKKADIVAKNQVTNVKAERAIMMWQGESDFVAKLYWTFSSKDYLYLVMEYLNGGDCASLIKVLGGLPEDWAKKYLGEVVLGVEHLHSRGIVHRDLKPDNLLINQEGHLKLTDFGLSRMGLIGRQKRVLNSSANDSALDLLKQGPFVAQQSSSITSSCSTSFDFNGHYSPGSTPLMTPDLAGEMAQPSYFSLNCENSLSRESRQSTDHRSDSGGSDTLNAMFSSFSLNECQAQQMFGQMKSPIEELSEQEVIASSELLALQQTSSQLSSEQKNTPPQTSMMSPPPMALYDPGDTNRRFVGTPDYLAPETINGIEQDEKSDWWSVGCILFELLYCYPPFHGETPNQVFENILARKIAWPNDDDCEVSPEAKDLMNKLLCMDPQERLGANKKEKFSSGGEEIRRHPWFTGTNWETLLEDELQFVPAPENLEDTKYFDARGATLKSFEEEMEDQTSPPSPTLSGEVLERPHDTLAKVQSQVNSMKRGLMPLYIPPRVRDLKSRGLPEPVVADDFGNFTFKNLPILEKANKDVIQKLRAEAMAARSKPVLASPVTGPRSMSASPLLEGSPIISNPIQQTLSNAKSASQPSSLSGFSQSNSPPSRASQPSSPLLLSFIAGQNGEGRRKTSSNSSSHSYQSSNSSSLSYQSSNSSSLSYQSSNSSSLSHQSSSSLQPGSFFNIPRLPASLQKAATTVGVGAQSPNKTRSAPTPLTFSPQRLIPQPRGSTPNSSARSQTAGSQEGNPIPTDLFSHRKRRNQVFDMSPSSSDNEGDKVNALLRVQRRRQSARRMSAINLANGPTFRPLDVLICEDHPVSRIVTEKLLEKLRCRTITVSNGAEAVRFAMSEIKFDIIMLEFKLPQISGADVARMVKETKNANSQTPIVAITGYLKELQQRHYFDELIEKPLTTSKLTEVLCRLCQWKVPFPDQASAGSLAYPMPSSLRQESSRLDGNSTSGSSGYIQMPGSSYRGSSREDSTGSSFFGDSESIMTDYVPVVISQKAAGDWDETGLGITNDEILLESPDLTKSALPHSIHQTSAQAQIDDIKLLVRQRSLDKVRAKRDAIEKHRHECAESGDDEDEVLGDVAVWGKSPKSSKIHKRSTLGTEVMRTNSHGSVGSRLEQTVVPEGDSPTSATEPPLVSEIEGAILTPPEVFTPPGKMIAKSDKPETSNPRSQASHNSIDEEPTPRAPSAESNPLDYLTLAATDR